MDSKELQQYGLSEKEARIYLALMEMGPSAVSEIAFRAKINRTTAYDILENLVRYTLVSYVGDKKTKHYVAENPELLVSFLNQQSREFKEKAEQAKHKLPELKSIYNLLPHKPKVKYYEGEEGIIAMYEDSLTSSTDILSWLDPSQTHEFSDEYMTEYYKRRAEKRIHMRTILKDSPLTKAIFDRDDVEDRESRIVPAEMMDIVPECYIYDDKVAYMSLREKFGVMIESKDIADAQRSLFELAWKQAATS